eukprot:380945-Prymnesium_polylepis.1
MLVCVGPAHTCTFCHSSPFAVCWAIVNRGEQADVARPCSRPCGRRHSKAAIDAVECDRCGTQEREWDL